MIFTQIFQISGALLAATLLGILTLLAFAPKASESSSGYGQSYGSSGKRNGGPEYDFYDEEFNGYKKRQGAGIVDGKCSCDSKLIIVKLVC